MLKWLDGDYQVDGLVFLGRNMRARRRLSDLAWGWRIDKIAPDRYDIIGAGIALVGVCVIMYWPRN